MMEEQLSRLDKAKAWASDNRYRLLAIFALIAVIILIIGLSLMWFVNNESLSTVGKIQRPAELKILGPGKTAIERLDLVYDKEQKDEIADDNDATATVRRGFCVQSGGNPFELMIANTTNISNLKIHVYRVSDTNAPASEATIAGHAGFTTYSWKKGAEITDFKLVNHAEDSHDSLAAKLTQNDPFGDYDNVQENARPLYRYELINGSLLDKDGSNPADATNFIIECTWKTKPNVKETDVVYLIARQPK